MKTRVEVPVEEGMLAAVRGRAAAEAMTVAGWIRRIVKLELDRSERNGLPRIRRNARGTFLAPDGGSGAAGSGEEAPPEESAAEVEARRRDIAAREAEDLRACGLED